MRSSWYAKALFDLTEKSTLAEDTLIQHFVGTITRNGHLHMLPRILRSYARIKAKALKRATIEVTTATPANEREVLALLRNEPFSRILSPKHKRVVRLVDPNIIGGTIARTSSARVDMSYKSMLVGIYQNMTNHL